MMSQQVVKLVRVIKAVLTLRCGLGLGTTQVVSRRFSAGQFGFFEMFPGEFLFRRIVHQAFYGPHPFPILSFPF